ncbi:hypothetical protein quinque_009668 [Culex quinquefasciatus]
MTLKVTIVFLAFVGAIAAQQYYQQGHHEEEHHAPAHYEYAYDGEYYLIDADGHKRTVTYDVDGKSGFIAQVHREPIKGYQPPQPQVHKVLAVPVQKAYYHH